MSLKIGVKFCGGCNCHYDRTALVNRFKDKYQDKITVEWANEKEIYDFLLVICGCSRACASYSQFQTKNPPMIITSDSPILLPDSAFEEPKKTVGGIFGELARRIQKAFMHR
jgi:4-hydroxybutyrate CoA-transferase